MSPPIRALTAAPSTGFGGVRSDPKLLAWAKDETRWARYGDVEHLPNSSLRAVQA